MKEYIKRIVDKELQLRLESFGATLIQGPKWCGKTTTAEQKAMSILRMQDTDKKEEYLETAKVKPSLLLKGDKPRLLDEWQVAPVLWDTVRVAVDEANEDGLFILTGSNTINKKEIMHSGIGRISRMKMYPMSLYESKESNGKISLKELFNNDNYDIDGLTSDLDIESLIFAACRGGWPSSLLKKTDDAKLFVAKDYLNGVCETEISTVDDVERNPRTTRQILRSYARNLSTLAKNSVLLQDTFSESDRDKVVQKTFDGYISALKSLFVIEDIPAWCPAIRSSSAIRAGEKREFIDPSIAVAALGVGPAYFENDMKTFGFIFECLCVRDLKVYSQASGGVISYYHDRYDLEVDFVLHLEDQRYALIECKLGSKDIENGAKHLVEVKRLIKEHNEKEKQCQIREPDLMIILTGGEMAYKRSDGVCVIPIGCLKD